MQKWTFIISRSPRSGDGLTGSPRLDPEERRRFENRVVAGLGDSGHNVLIVPHIYDLRRSHPAAERLESESRNIALASWLAPRAAFWTLNALGVSGRCFDPPRDGSVVPDVKPLLRSGAGSEGSARAIYCCDFGALSSVNSCVEELRRVAGLDHDGAALAAGTPAVEEISDSVSSRWYPVLDYSRCAHCRQCLEFCLFDVYSLEEEKVVVKRPDECKPGCPACARICPEGAIMFPHYTSDPAIAGVAGAKISSGDDDASFLSASERSMLGRRESAAAERERFTPADSSDGRGADDSGYDELDDLIEALDKLDG